MRISYIFLLFYFPREVSPLLVAAQQRCPYCSPSSGNLPEIRTEVYVYKLICLRALLETLNKLPKPLQITFVDLIQILYHEWTSITP